MDEIQLFYREHGRIPYKEEFPHYGAVRNRFGTWNKAIEAAGFSPNPVRFAKKYIANDGHKCDSLAEKIIDDWFSARHITHETKVPYHKKRMTADFRVHGTYIEFLGLAGQLVKYDQLVGEKEKFWQDQKLDVIAVYPKDLFPVSRLDEIFAPLYS